MPSLKLDAVVLVVLLISDHLSPVLHRGSTVTEPRCQPH